MRRSAAALLALTLAAAASVPLLTASPLLSLTTEERAVRALDERYGLEPPETGFPPPGLTELFQGDIGWSVKP